ncbi:hypothetical protein SAMN05216359_11452 [Roseateles sp. YR242]|uniref:hypothetical protein n=1 Tax=Roseateles sp. YR242 TaxID=1855305 RepID=UPI0008C2E7B5|nr:hypothetical protein [Roseateles sp. YR242]SEL70154.1 hypothetical protein SAMN05216359_11452 [Roseateles sp. YR242]
MYRCAMPARPGSRAPQRALRALAASIAVFTATVGTALLPQTAQAQAAIGHRFFPAKALRGVLVVGVPPEVTLNGKSARLAPGARIKDANDMVALSNTIAGQKLTVHYTVDISGLLMDVWVLNSVELANKPWPSNYKEASEWAFDAANQKWTKSSWW